MEPKVRGFPLVEDKIKIARLLDGFGWRYIEGGYPGANPRTRSSFAELLS